MARTKRISFEGKRFEMQPRSIGRGGQGMVYQARSGDGQWAIVKELPDTKHNRKRVERLIELQAGYMVPGLSAPLAMNVVKSRKVLLYLATFSPGVVLEEDRARTLPELMQMAVLSAGIWSRLEAMGISHGDIAPSNVMVRDDGTVDLIDIDNYALADGSAPKPQMIGQHAMAAPELRSARNNGGNRTPDLESDRFAWAVLFHILLFGAHPADGLVQTPKEFDQLMSAGVWPGEQRQVQAGEMPTSVMGDRILELFRGGFSLDSSMRPDAREWMAALSEGLSNLQVHDCGGAFVVEAERGVCPWCGGSYMAKASEVVLFLRNPVTGEESELQLADGAFVYLGRNTMPGVSPYVSGRHVRLYRHGRTIYMEHVGRNGTSIRLAGNGVDYALDSYRASLDDGCLDGAVLRMADTQVQIGFAPK